MTSEESGGLIGQVGRFLFKPQELTVPFLIVMIGLVLYGVVRAVLGVRAFRSELGEAAGGYKQHRPTEPALDYLRRRASPEKTLRTLEALPSMLVTLGILGTFLGLGVAVHQAVPALASSTSPDAVRLALGELLKTVSFKFQASAWGIILSLLLTSMLEVMKEALFKLLEEEARRLASYRRLAERVMAQEIGAVLGDALNRVGEALQQLGGLTDASNRMAEQVFGLQQSVESLKSTAATSAKSLESASGRLGDVGKTIDASLVKVGNVIGVRLAESNEQLASGMKEQTKQQRTTLDSLQNALVGAAKAQTNAAENQAAAIGKQMKENAETLKKGLTDMRANLEANLNAVTSKMQSSLETQAKTTKEMQENLRSALSPLSTAVGQFGAALESLNKYQSAQNAVLEGLNKRQAEFSEQLDRLLQILDRSQGQAAKQELEKAAQSRPREASASGRSLRPPPAIASAIGVTAASKKGGRDDEYL